MNSRFDRGVRVVGMEEKGILKGHQHVLINYHLGYLLDGWGKCCCIEKTGKYGISKTVISCLFILEDENGAGWNFTRKKRKMKKKANFFK